MPGDPRKCREHAATCRQLADSVTGATARKAFLNLAETWERLASELESSAIFVQALNAIEPLPEPKSSQEPLRKGITPGAS